MSHLTAAAHRRLDTACAAGCTNTAPCPPGRCVRAGTGNAIVDAFDGMIERAEAPRNREADRARFPDPAFNRWLDEGIADGGWIVWDQICSTVDAWAGWQNREFYQAAPRPEAQPVAWRFRFPSGGRWHYTEHGPHEHSKQGLTWEPLHAAPQPTATAAQPVHAGGWEGAEEWMPLAWKLCADENGEEACSELVWEGGAIPEPWGDRWLKYEDEAKRLIRLVREFVPALQPAAPAAPRPLPEHCTKPGADGKPCGLLPPCPDCGRAVHDVPEGA